MSTLIDVIKQESTLRSIIEELESHPSDLVLRIGLSEPHSYRGYYEDLAFEPKENVTVKECLRVARKCLGETFTGYKGGKYTMNDYTACWFAEYGSSNGAQLSPLVIRLLAETSQEPK